MIIREYERENSTRTLDHSSNPPLIPSTQFNPNETVYLDLLEEVLLNGRYSPDRTGVGTLSLPARTATYNLQSSFPLLTTKKVSFKFILGELLWFLNGETNIRSLQNQGITIWDEWADENGDLGPVYGAQWRNFNGQGIDQIKNLIDEMMENPMSRRLIVSAWNPAQNSQMALPPCHSFFQLIVTSENSTSYHDDEGRPYGDLLVTNPEAGLRVYRQQIADEEVRRDEVIGAGDENRLRPESTPSRKPHLYFSVDMVLYQRSGDMFLGVPYNISSYSMLLSMICEYASNASELRAEKEEDFLAKHFTAKNLHHTIGDCHIYLNHVDQVKEQLSRKPSYPPSFYTSGMFRQNWRDGAYLKNLDPSWFSVSGYTPQDAIKAPVAV